MNPVQRVFTRHGKLVHTGNNNHIPRTMEKHGSAVGTSIDIDQLSIGSKSIGAEQVIIGLHLLSISSLYFFGICREATCYVGISG